MMHLAWPWMAVLLPLPWVMYRYRSAAEPGGMAIFLPFAATLDRPLGGAPTAARLRQALFVLLWLLLVLAAMRPQWLGDPLPAPTTGRRVILAVDISGSMNTRDMANNASRLQVVQQVAGQFIDGRQGDQVGLILFGTQPYVQAPLTPDLATVHRFLDEALVGCTLCRRGGAAHLHDRRRRRGARRIFRFDGQQRSRRGHPQGDRQDHGWSIFPRHGCERSAVGLCADREARAGRGSRPVVASDR